MNLETHKWAKLLRDYWPAHKRLVDTDSAERWEGALSTFFGANMPDDDELCAVVHAMSTSAKRFPPSLKELRIAVCMHRKPDSDMPDEVEDGCAACNHGWITYRPGHEEPDSEPDPCWWCDAEAYPVPCACSYGQDVAHKVYPDQDARLILAKARVAIKQKASIDRRARELVDGKTQAQARAALETALASVGTRANENPSTGAGVPF